MATDINPARRAPTEDELAEWAHNLLRAAGHRMTPEACAAVGQIYDQIDARRAKGAAAPRKAA